MAGRFNARFDGCLAGSFPGGKVRAPRRAINGMVSDTKKMRVR